MHDAALSEHGPKTWSWKRKREVLSWKGIIHPLCVKGIIPLKVPCFHDLTKKGVGEGGLRVSKPEMVVLLVLRYEGSEHREPRDPSEPCKPFRLIQFRKNASASPLVSHTFKTKDLKPFRFTHFQKKRGGTPVFERRLHSSVEPPQPKRKCISAGACGKTQDARLKRSATRMAGTRIY